MKQGNNNYRVVFEIEVDADTPLDAAKEVEDMLQNSGNHWQFFVQDEDSLKITSVDLDEDTVTDSDKYKPLISK